MPVFAVKSGMTGSGNSSDQLRRLSSPEEEKASFTSHGPTANAAPAMVAFFSIVRRLKRLAALSVNAADEAGFLAVIRELPVLKENEAFTARPHGSCFCFDSGRGTVRCSAVSRQIYDVRVTGPL